MVKAKRTIIYVLLGFLYLCSAQAKGSDYEVFFHTGLGNYLTLKDVERNDTVTVLRMRYKALPGESYLIPDDLYLSDENDQRYPLRQALGIQTGVRNRFPLSGVINFDLHFAPLPKKCKVFDLLRGVTYLNSEHFELWGIHPKNYKLEKKTKYSDVMVLTDSTIMQDGTVTIQGKILDFVAGKSPSNITMMYTPILYTYIETQWPDSIFVNNDGSFQTVVPQVNCPSWSYLNYDDLLIPIFLVPGDTLQITMSQVFSNGRRVEYTSKTHKDLHPNLLKADQQITLWENYNSRAQTICPEDLKNKVDEYWASLLKISGYLKWKFHLNDFETHLLYLSMTSKINEISNSRFRADLKAVGMDKQLEEMGKREYFDYVTTEEWCNYYTFLKNDKLNDFSYFMLPEQKLIRTLSLVQTATYRPKSESFSYDLRIPILETYLGYELNSYMRKALEEKPPVFKNRDKFMKRYNQ